MHVCADFCTCACKFRACTFHACNVRNHEIRSRAQTGTREVQQHFSVFNPLFIWSIVFWVIDDLLMLAMLTLHGPKSPLTLQKWRQNRTLSIFAFTAFALSIFAFTTFVWLTTLSILISFEVKFFWVVCDLLMLALLAIHGPKSPLTLQKWRLIGLYQFLLSHC